MKMKKSQLVAAAGAAITVALAGAGVATATSDDDAGDTPITGAALERASEEALTHTGQGRVTGTEVGDEDSYYEVEVTLDDGSQVDVQLDEAFTVVDTMSDSDSGAESGSEGQG